MIDKQKTLAVADIHRYCINKMGYPGVFLSLVRMCNVRTIIML